VLDGGEAKKTIIWMGISAKMVRTLPSNSMKGLPGVCALDIVVVTKQHKKDTKVCDKRSKTSVQCTAYTVAKFGKCHKPV
jgi:hypothetical protein